MTKKRQEKSLNKRKIWGRHPGEWIAFSADKKKVIAHGKKLNKVAQTAAQKGCENPVFAYTPPKGIIIN